MDNPFYRFFRRHDVPMTWRKWERLPRFPSYKNEYWDGEAHYSPKIQTVDMYLDLARWKPLSYPSDLYWTYRRERIDIRQLREQDWGHMPEAFYLAFGEQPPLMFWHEYAAKRAAHAIVDWTRRGRDGPLVRDACFSAWGSDDKTVPGSELNLLCGAAIVVMVDAGLCRGVPDGAGVPHPEKPDELILPHLNWIFVNAWLQHMGIGSRLLGEVVHALRERGFRWLCSTVLTGNSNALLWHWRNGFVLGPQWGHRLATFESKFGSLRVFPQDC